MLAFGADPVEVDAATIGRTGEPQIFGLWADNEPAMMVLLAMRTQMRRAGMNGAVCGLDYAVLPWVMRQMGVGEEQVSEVFGQVRQAESEMLAVLSEGSHG